jgi:hypothetical protein
MSAPSPIRPRKKHGAATGRKPWVKPPGQRKSGDPKGTYALFKWEQVFEAFRENDWRVIGLALLPDLTRISASAGVMSILGWVAAHTTGGVYGLRGSRVLLHKKGGRTKFSCTLTTADFHKLCGRRFSRRYILKVVSYCLEQGFLLQRGETGEAKYQYALDLERIQNAPTAEPEPGEDEAKNEGQNASFRASDGSRDLHGGEGTSDQWFTDENGGGDGANEKRMLCRTPGPKSNLLLPGNWLRLGSSMDAAGHEVAGIDVQSDHPVNVTAYLDAKGDMKIRISLPPAEAKAEPIREIPEQAAPQESPGEGPKLPPTPAPADPVPGMRRDQLLLGLADRNLRVTPAYADKVLAGYLPDASVGHLLATVDQEIANAKAKGKTFVTSWLPHTARQAAASWPTVAARPPQGRGYQPSEREKRLANEGRRAKGLPERDYET